MASGCWTPPCRTICPLASWGSCPGGTLYVNLEPCNHHGRTPPCTEAIIAAGIKRVVVGMVDPDPRVRGTGIARLRSAGVVAGRGNRRNQMSTIE
jgi:diaminohydroxyphosphoribosylaminopyrimidine deaminase/5-amino-6-(5-phosphoribosylamino)uracil reductase